LMTTRTSNFCAKKELFLS